MMRAKARSRWKLALEVVFALMFGVTLLGVLFFPVELAMVLPSPWGWVVLALSAVLWTSGLILFRGSGRLRRL